MLLISSLLTIPVTAIDRYRNENSSEYIYTFSSDVFKNLPPMPSNLFEVKRSFALQKITAEIITPDFYLQPEFYPEWFETANMTFRRDPRLHGRYGYGVYPSSLTVYLKEAKPSPLNLSFFFYTSWGVETYQGIMLDFEYNHSLLALEIIYPDNAKDYYSTPQILKPWQKVILLYPTYPSFNKLWARKIKINIQFLKTLTENTTVKLNDGIPPSALDKLWREKYGLNYTSGGSLLQLMIPCLTITFVPYSSNNISYKEKKAIPWFIFLFFIPLIILLCLWIRKKYSPKKHVKS